jgi:hypothetical protein
VRVVITLQERRVLRTVCAFADSDGWVRRQYALPFELQHVANDLVARGWLEAHPTRVFVARLTTAGRDALHAADAAAVASLPSPEVARRPPRAWGASRLAGLWTVLDVRRDSDGK